MDSRYQNGKIYKLVCDATPIVYYGSTIRSLAQRLAKHKAISNNCGSKELFELGNVSIVLVEEYPCNSMVELKSRERIYIEFMLNNFNHRVICNERIPTRTKEEWYQDNKEYVNEKTRKWRHDNIEYYSEYKKQHYQKNREFLNEKQKKHYQNNKESISKKRNEKFNCDCGGKYTMANKARHLKTQNHKDYIGALENESYQDNKESINEKFNCDCGGRYTKSHKSHHFKTKKHLEYINSLGIES